MNRQVVGQLFPKALDAIDAGQCPTCNKLIGTFRNVISQCEFGISGMCQECQDSVFGKDKADPPEKVGLESNVFIVNKPYSMFSGAVEAAKFVYRKIVDSKGHVWLYPSNSKDLKSQGYGGSTLQFALHDGTVYAAKGPWHANADEMLQATGVDIRNTYRTYGCVAKRRVYKGNVHEYREILHADIEPLIGEFDRLRKIAQEWADKLGHPVVYYSESKGGSSSGWEIPKGTNYQQWTTDWFAKHAE